MSEEQVIEESVNNEEVVENEPTQQVKPSITDILSGKSKQEEPVEPIQGEEDEEVTISRSELDDLLSRLNNSAKDRLSLVSPTKPLEKVEDNNETQSVSEKPRTVPEVEMPKLTQEEFFEIQNNPEKFAEFIAKRDQAISQKTVETILQTMPDKMTNMFGQMWDVANVTQKFFDRYPEMEKYPYQVAEEVSNIRRENPGETPARVMQLLEQRMAIALRLKKAVEGGNNVTVRQPGQFAPEKTGTRKSVQAPSGGDNLTPTQKVINDIKGLRSR